MKTTIMTIVIALLTLNVQAQTTKKIWEKYRDFPGAQYVDNTEAARKDLESRLNNHGNNAPNRYAESAYKSFKRSQQVQITLDETQKQELEHCLNSLDRHHEKVLAFNSLNKTNVNMGPFNQLLGLQPDSTMNVGVYAKSKGKMLTDILIRFDMFGQTVLSFQETSINKDALLQSLQEQFAMSGSSAFSLTDDDGDEDEEGIDFGNSEYVSEDTEALIVINGEVHPELHNIKDTEEYLKKNNLHPNHFHTYLGDSVQEHYPDATQRVAFACWEEGKK